MKIVLTVKEGEGFDAWRAVNKYEPTAKASVVEKLAEILRTPFDGDLLDALTTFDLEPRDDQFFPENWLHHCRYGPEQHERTSFDERHGVRQLDEFCSRSWVDRAREKNHHCTDTDGS